ncbi:MAG: hypothetical protein V1899_04300 [Planctomycetota bacterium]
MVQIRVTSLLPQRLIRAARVSKRSSILGCMSLNVAQAFCLFHSLTLLLKAGWEPALRLVVALSDMHPESSQLSKLD